MWGEVSNLIKEISISFAAVLFIICSFWIFINLLRVMCYEIKIENLEKERQKEINEIKIKTGQAIDFVEGQIRRVNENYNPVIDNIRRKRNFILDRTPFIKQ
jgi:hypothetical protein